MTADVVATPALRSRPDRIALGAAWIAAALGLASAAISAWWVFGGDALLDTVGGDIEGWGRERGITVIVSLSLIVVLKATVAIAAPILAGVGRGRLPTWTIGRVPRVLGWIAAIVLTVYGGLLTIAGVFVQADVIEAARDADARALAWHAYFWDPWFALWGLAFVVALWRARSRVPQAQDDRELSTDPAR